jgi:flagellar biogenesis protein FliO
MKGSGGKRDIEVIERLNLGPQHSLQLVRVREHIFLIGLSSGKMDLLSDITAKDGMPK